jgi:predicted CXXCH cytochrome family protein
MLLTLPSSGLDGQTLPVSDDCRDCHLSLQDERLSAPARLYEADVHAETGFGCLACHGSGGQDRLDPAAGFLSSPSRREIPEMCGRCHSDAAFMRQFDPGLRVDQVAEYWTSRHGELLQETNDPAVATCIDCHPAHEIRPPDDPESTVHAANIVPLCGSCHADPVVMAARDVSTAQVAEYTSGVHGRLLIEEGDLTAPVCNDCHGNHGAAPPGLASVQNVCGQCHTVMADYFDQSGHAQIFQEEDLASCSLCHGHHDTQPVEDVTLVERTEDVCFTCHVPPDTLGLEFQRMAAVLDSLEEAEEAGRSVLEEAQTRGMEVSQALFELEDLGNVRTRAHSAIHTFHVENVREEVAVGVALAARAEEAGYAALEEYTYRRVGLGTFAVIIVLLILGLTLKIREYEERMEGLISGVEAFYRRSLFADGRRTLTEQEIQLAVSALMLEVCHARRRFGLEADEAEQLIRLAEHERGLPGQLDRITAMIGESLPFERKWVLVDELWALVGVDGEASPDEVAFMERLMHLIGIAPADAAAARNRGGRMGSPPDEEEEEEDEEECT